MRGRTGCLAIVRLRLGCRGSQPLYVLHRFAKCRNPLSMARTSSSIDPVRVFRALGHGTRLQIAQALVGREHCVNDLRELVGTSWSTVSQHLAVLRIAGIVASTKQGNQVVYRLALPCVAAFTRCLLAAAEGKQVEVRTCCR